MKSSKHENPLRLMKHIVEQYQPLFHVQQFPCGTQMREKKMFLPNMSKGHCCTALNTFT